MMDLSTEPSTIRPAGATQPQVNQSPERKLVREAFVSLVDTLQADLVKLHELNQKYKSDLSSERKTVVELRSELREKQRRIRELHQRVQNAEAVSGRVQHDTRAAVEIRVLEVQGLRSENRELKAEINSHETTNAAQREQILKLERDLAAANAKKAQLERAGLNGRGNPSYVSDYRSRLDSDYADNTFVARSRFAGGEDATSAVIAMERETMRKTYDDLLAQERSTHAKQRQALQSELRQLHLRTASLEESKERAEATASEAKSAELRLRGECREANTKVRDLEQKLKTLTQGVADTASAQAVQQQQQQNAQQQQQLQQQEQILKQRQQLQEQAEQMQSLAVKQDEHIAQQEKLHQLRMEELRNKLERDIQKATHDKQLAEQQSKRHKRESKAYHHKAHSLKSKLKAERKRGNKYKQALKRVVVSLVDCCIRWTLF